jgi:hypothetical protein
VVVELFGARQTGASASGSGGDLEDCKAKFKAAWTAIRAGLSEDDIASAREYAENSAEIRPAIAAVMDFVLGFACI